MKLHRRDFLTTAAAGAAGIFLGSGARPALADGSKGFRFVHLTDLHIQPERAADQGVTKCLKAIESLNPKPDFIMLGGDLVYDVFDNSETRAKLLYDMLLKTFADNTGLPVKPCMGNHDILGWGKKSGVDPTVPLYGKKMFCERFQQEKTYHAFDHKGWRFYALDNIQKDPDGAYISYLDDEQYAWLEADLKAKPAATPAVVVSHIPIMTVTIISDKAPQFKDGAYHLGIGGICRDARKLTSLFSQYNVKLALSGHIHELDRIDFRNVTFICDGAVSGGWWKGPNNDYVQEGFGILDVNADGTFTHQYHDYGWEPKA